MRATISMRVRDWFASHFKSVQYSIPRRGRGNTTWPVQALALTLAITTVLGKIFADPKQRKALFIALLFVAAFMAWLTDWLTTNRPVFLF